MATAIAAAAKPPMEAPTLDAAPVKVKVPEVVGVRPPLAVVFVPAPLPEPLPLLLAAAAVVAGTKAAAGEEPDAVMVEKATCGTVMMVEMVMVVEEPAMVLP